MHSPMDSHSSLLTHGQRLLMKLQAVAEQLSVKAFVISETAHLRMNELLVIGFKLGVHKRNQHDMLKKEKMDQIFKYKCCIAFLLGCKTNKYDGVLKNAQNQLQILGLFIQDLEGGQEYLFRHLIETRFSILQYPQPQVLQFMQAYLLIATNLMQLDGTCSFYRTVFILLEALSLLYVSRLLGDHPECMELYEIEMPQG